MKSSTKMKKEMYAKNKKWFCLPLQCFKFTV